jgi:anti-anti-sigma factor
MTESRHGEPLCAFELRRGDDGSLVLELRGELDLSTEAELGAQLDGCLSGDGHDDVIVDLRGVTFMDSTGLAQLARGRRRAEELGRRFALCTSGGQVQRLLELAGLSDSFTFAKLP